MNIRVFLLFILFLLLVSFKTSAQCTSAPLESSFSCSGGNGASSDGQTINNTEVYWFTGTGTYNNQVNIEKGGTFIVCGDLTLNSGLNIKGDAGGRGVLVVMSGGKITINSNTSLDGAIYNYGELEVNSDFTVNAGGAQFINASTSSTYSVSGRFTVNGSTNFSNFGTATLFDVRSNASSTVCLGAGSQLNLTGVLANDGANSWSAPSGLACVGYTSASNSALNQSLTLDSDLQICEATGAGVISNEGSATRNTGCTDCNSIIALPVKYLAIKAFTKTDNEINLEWTTAFEINNDYFSVEISQDGSNFNEVNQIDGAGTSNQALSYIQTIDVSSLNFPIYLKLTQVDFDGTQSVSKIIVVDNARFTKKEETFEIFPNPVLEQDYIDILINTKYTEFDVQVFSTTGVMYSSTTFSFERDVSSSKQLIIPFEGDKGSYFIRIVLPDKILTETFVSQ